MYLKNVESVLKPTFLALILFLCISIVKIVTEFSINHTSLQDWRDSFRRGGVHCKFGSYWSTGAQSLGYKYEADQNRASLIRKNMCPETFNQTAAIYDCNRVGEYWIDHAFKNKVGQLDVYLEFEDFLAANQKSDSTGLASFSSFSCPFEVILTNLYPALNSFYPATYRITSIEQAQSASAELEKKWSSLTEELRSEDLYILKPVDSHAAVGLEIMDISGAIKWLTNVTESPRDESTTFPTGVLQKFLSHPLLWDGRKFQLRMWAIIYSSDPLMVTAHVGHLNRAHEKFSLTRLGAFTNAQPKNMTRKLMELHYRGYSQLIEHFRTHGDQLEKENGRIYPPDFVEAHLIPAGFDIIAYTIAAWYSNEKRVPRPRDGNKTTAETGFYDASVIQRLCYDFVIEADGTLYLTEENRICADPSSFGNFRGFAPIDFLPEWKRDLVLSLTSRAIEIAEEIHLRKLHDKPYQFQDLMTPFGYHVPLIDQTEYRTLTREDKALCYGRSFTVEDIAKPFRDNLHFQEYEYVNVKKKKKKK